MNNFLHLWNDQQGQDVAEYAVMLAVIFGACCGHDSIGRQQRQQRILFRGEFSSVGTNLNLSGLHGIERDTIPLVILQGV